MRPALLRRAAVTVLAGGVLLAPAAPAFAQPETHETQAHETQAHIPEHGGGPAEGPNPYFLLAGGAMTAAGAAGLVYASVRRGRSDG